MKAREFNPDRLDVAVFAQAGASLSGQWPLSELERLAAGAIERSDLAGRPVVWEVTGELRPRRAGEPEVWLHLRASAAIALECQRCLQPVVEPLELECSIRFVPGEEDAAELDADSDDDVLALTRSLDLKALVEDELLLALPIVPRHEVCPAPLRVPADRSSAGDEQATENAKPNPFAALAALKRGSQDEGGGH